MISPLQQILQAFYERFLPLNDGAVATYIPELGLANPDDFAICIATVDGHVYCAGDASVPFTIQSISKPFVYGLALHDLGTDEVMRTTGVEPSGEAFNAISLEPGSGRPRNPMINAGAIATAATIRGDGTAEKLDRTMVLLSRFAGRNLSIDEDVYRSERDTGHRNRAIGYLLRNAGIVGDDVDDALDRYFRQCSVLVTARDLAVMAATLANGGANPLTGDVVLSNEYVENVLSVMSTCGMYDYAGSWAYRVGMPAKSGVSGGVIAVLPGQLGIGIYSPRLDEFGNTVRGVAVCEAFSREFGLHLLRPPVNTASAVLTTYSLADVSSKRRRSQQQMRCLAERGDAVRIIRIQGPLVLSTAEVIMRRAIDDARDCGIVVFDCQRIEAIDAPVSHLFRRFVDQFAERDGVVVFSGLRDANDSNSFASDRSSESFATIDLALEWCEDQILGEAGLVPRVSASMLIDQHPLLWSLAPDETRALSSVLQRRCYAPGSTIIRQGEDADAIFLLVEGEVSVNLSLQEADRYRVATIGPGGTFGELALLDDEPRTADVDAETEAVCYVLPIADLADICVAVPTLRLKLAEQVARDLAARLRRADREIMALAS
jgi:glutaminase